MTARSEFLTRLRIGLPIFQAPLAGGGDTPALVAAVSEAGGLGFIGAAYLTRAQIFERAREVRERTSRPFGTNLFVPSASLADAPNPDPAAAIAAITPYYRELGLPDPGRPEPEDLVFEEQLAAALVSGASVFSFTLGCLPPETIERIKAHGLVVLGTASTVEEAKQLEAAGVDGIVLQGAEAGGHRCSFDGPMESALIGTVALIPQVVDSVRAPVIASGGIMDGRGIVAAMALGASAVQMGTAFLTTDEAGVCAAYKDAILAAREDQTRLTRAFSGRPARGVVNRFMTEIDERAAAVPETVLPFPLQNALTRPLRAAGTRANRADVLSLWAGQGARMARRTEAGTLVGRLASEITWTLARLDTERTGASTYDLHRQARSDRIREIGTVARMIARTIHASLGRLSGRFCLFCKAAAEGVRIARGAPPLGDVGTRGARLTAWSARVNTGA